MESLERRTVGPQGWQRAVATIVGLAAACLAVRVLPYSLSSRNADGYFDGNAGYQSQLLHGAGRDLLTITEPERFYGPGARNTQRFHTGNRRFDGEWKFGTFAMTAIGAAQAATEHRELAHDAEDVLHLALETLMHKDTRAYDTEAWQGHDALESLDAPGQDHCAYLCYLAFSLGTARLADPHFAYREQHDRIIAALERKLNASSAMLLETYPGEYYPIDNAMAIGALGLHQEATGTSHESTLNAWEKLARAKYLDPATGLIYQSATREGEPRDSARASGTALSSYALARGLPTLSRDLWQAARKHLFTRVLGFGAMREYPRTSTGHGDIDSGPVIFGLGISGSGFALGAARVHGDREAFRALYASAHLMGVPVQGDDRRNFVTGGPIGQGILFAMLTAPVTPPDRRESPRPTPPPGAPPGNAPPAAPGTAPSGTAP
jgi:hypothetical protein